MLAEKVRYSAFDLFRPVALWVAQFPDFEMKMNQLSTTVKTKTVEEEVIPLSDVGS